MTTIAPDPLVDLLLLADAKAYLTDGSIPLPSDSTLQLLITAVSTQIQSFINRRIPLQAYSATFDGKGTRAIAVANFPLVSVDSLSVDGITIPASTGPTSVGFTWDEQRVALRGYEFCRGMLNCAVSFHGGYANIPADLVRFCLEGLSMAVQALPRDPDLVSEKAGDTQFVYASASRAAISQAAKMCLTSDITSGLMQYARVPGAI